MKQFRLFSMKVYEENTSRSILKRRGFRPHAQTISVSNEPFYFHFFHDTKKFIGTTTVFWKVSPVCARIKGGFDSDFEVLGPADKATSDLYVLHIWAHFGRDENLSWRLFPFDSESDWIVWRSLIQDLRRITEIMYQIYAGTSTEHALF